MYSNQPQLVVIISKPLYRILMLNVSHNEKKSFHQKLIFYFFCEIMAISNMTHFQTLIL